MENLNQQIEMPIPNDDHKMDPVEALMREKFNSKPSLDSKCCIYKVTEFIRKGKEESFQPSVVSIGPAYYKDPKLQSMQPYKWYFLDSFLQHPQNACRSLDCYINIVRELNEHIRDCYDESLMKSCDGDEFIAMIVLDAVFLISLFMELVPVEANIHPPNKLQVLMRYMQRDLLLEENQLPFFVLRSIFDLAFPTQPPSLVDLARGYIKTHDGYPGSDCVATVDIGDASNIAHLIDLWREWCCFSFRTQQEQKPFEVPRTAKELSAAGVKFMKSESLNPLSITFNKDNGELHIPCFIVSADTKDFLRNFLYFEQCHYYSTGHPYFTDLLVFLDSLIDTAEDIQLLKEKGILETGAGSDKNTANLFNRTITADTFTKSNFFSYSHISQEVNEYANRSLNRYMAILRRDYFHHPWAIISFIFAVLLFILTVLQTITGFTKN